MRPTRLALFDVDGTLLDSGRIGRRAIDRLFEREFGIADATGGYVFDGKTDPLIFRELRARHDLPAVAAADEPLYERYLELLGEEGRRTRDGRVLEGVADTLARLEPATHVTVGLLTGNLSRGARIKLERFDLWDRFPFGAFGEDGHERADLVPVARERGQAHGGGRFAWTEVVVIGDSVRDVACAHAHGAVAVAVATGGTPAAELRAAGAELVLESLADPAPLLELLDVP